MSNEEISGSDPFNKPDLRFILNFNEAAEIKDEKRLTSIILNVPNYLNCYPYPNVINRVISRLTHVFLHSSNLLKQYISRVMIKCQAHVIMITNFSDIVSKLSSVLYSSDPIERGTVLVVLSALAPLLSKQQSERVSVENVKIDFLYNQIIISLESNDISELESAILVSRKFTKFSSTYAGLLLNRLPSILNSCSDSEIFKKLIFSFSYMSHSVSMAESSFNLSLSYIDMAPAEILNTVTKLVKNCSCLVKSYIKYCLEYLRIANNAKLRDFALIQLRIIIKVYPTCLTQNEINLMFSDYFPHNKCHFMYFLCVASYVNPDSTVTMFDCLIPELLDCLGNPCYLSVAVLTVFCNLLLRKPGKLSIQTQNIDFLCSTFQKFFLVLTKSNSPMLLEYISRLFDNFLILCPKASLINCNMGGFIVQNMCFRTNFSVSQDKIINWLYIIHSCRLIMPNFNDYSFLCDETISMYKKGQHKKGTYKYISFILVVQSRFKNFDNNNSCFFENICLIPFLDLYRIATILTVVDLHLVATRIFSHLSTNHLISTELKNYFEFLKTLTGSEVSSFNVSPTLLTNNSYLQNNSIRCNFQKKYANARIHSLKIGNTISSMLKNCDCIDSRENDLSYVNFFLSEFLREIQQLEQSWMSIYQCTYDGDLESKNLLKTYSNLFKLLYNLLTSREACSSYLKIFDVPLHPFCVKTLGYLKLLFSQNLSYHDKLYSFVCNVINIEWPFPLYFYKSKLIIKSAMNYILQKERRDDSTEICCKLNEIFNFSTQGYFKIQKKSNCKHFEKIKQLKIIALYSKTSQPDAPHYDNKFNSCVNIVELTNDYFQTDFGVKFDQIGKYELNIFVDSIIDENDHEWYYSGISCPKIIVSVSSKFLFGNIKQLF